MATYIKPEAIKDSSLPIEKIDNVALDLANKVNALDDSNKALFLNKINAMPATPSGDPMHYAYVAAGAEYNDTGADIVKDTPWADLADDDADKTVVHKAGYWYLNGLGDMTNDELDYLSLHDQSKYEYLGRQHPAYTLGNTESRTFFRKSGNFVSGFMANAMYTNKVVVIQISEGTDTKDAYPIRDLNQFCSYQINPLRHILGVVNCSSPKLEINESAFLGQDIMTIKLKYLHKSVWFPNTEILTCKTVLYMINNEKATSPITITLHKTVYDRCMANVSIQAALETHTNVSLASA